MNIQKEVQEEPEEIIEEFLLWRYIAELREVPPTRPEMSPDVPYGEFPGGVH